MKVTKRIMALALLSVQLLVTASCGDTKDRSVTTDETGGDTTAAETKEPSLLDQMETVDYNRDFTMLLRDTNENRMYPSIDDEETTSDVLNNAVYERNLAVAEKFGINLKAVLKDGTWPSTEYTKHISATVMAGLGTYDMIDGMGSTIGANFAEGLFYNLLEIPELNLDAKWWSSVTKEALTVNDTLYAMAGDYSTFLWEGMYVTLFSKPVLAEFDLENPYDLVREGKWTIDKMIEMSKDIYLDLNQNNEADGGDRFGAMFDNDPLLHAFHTSFGMHFTVKNPDGSISLNILNEQTETASVKIRDWVYDSGDVMYAGRIPFLDGSSAASKFANHEILFWGTFLLTGTKLRDMEADFGVLPYPKWNEEQTDYFTPCGDGRIMIVVPTDVKDVAFAGTIIEALTRAGHEMIIPIYQDKVLKVKELRDEDSLEMLEICRNGLYLDFADEYAPQTNMLAWQWRFSVGGDTSFTSNYNANKRAGERAFENFLKAYE